MGRTSSYRAKAIEIVESADDRYNSLCEDEEPYSFMGTPDEEFDIKWGKKEAETILNLLDALKSIGIVEGKGFCDELAKVTGYSKTRISNMLSQATLNSRFIKAVCSGFGFNEDYITDRKGEIKADNKYQPQIGSFDVAINEAISVLQRMPEPDRWHAVSVLKKLEENSGKNT